MQASLPVSVSPGRKATPCRGGSTERRSFLETCSSEETSLELPPGILWASDLVVVVDNEVDERSFETSVSDFSLARVLSTLRHAILALSRPESSRIANHEQEG